MIENIEKRTININRKMKKQFKTKKDFEERVKAEIEADKNGNVSVDQLRDFVLNLCQDDLIQHNIAKKDVEGFLSAFCYNAYGAMNVGAISDLVFTRDDEIHQILAHKKRGNPPPAEVNQDFDKIDVTESDKHNAKIK